MMEERMDEGGDESFNAEVMHYLDDLIHEIDCMILMVRLR